MPQQTEAELDQVKLVLDACVKGFKLKLVGTHGINHWIRVLNNGRRLCANLGIPHLLVDLFALLHDSQRFTDGKDPEHGLRAEHVARELSCSGSIRLPACELEVLSLACRLHSTGIVEGPLLAQVCWDADRLDLGRVGIVPDLNRLCTAVARQKDIYDWAVCRGYRKVMEDFPWQHTCVRRNPCAEPTSYIDRPLSARG